MIGDGEVLVRARKIAENIIDIQCCECEEFTKSLSMSQCWCDDIVDMVDRELLEINRFEDHEEAVANEWERIRRSMIGDDL